jgi:hypothetical protein
LNGRRRPALGVVGTERHLANAHECIWPPLPSLGTDAVRAKGLAADDASFRLDPAALAAAHHSLPDPRTVGAADCHEFRESVLRTEVVDAGHDPREARQDLRTWQ